MKLLNTENPLEGAWSLNDLLDRLVKDSFFISTVIKYLYKTIRYESYLDYFYFFQVVVIQLAGGSCKYLYQYGLSIMPVTISKINIDELCKPGKYASHRLHH